MSSATERRSVILGRLSGYGGDVPPVFCCMLSPSRSESPLSEVAGDPRVERRVPRSEALNRSGKLRPICEADDLGALEFQLCLLDLPVMLESVWPLES